MNTIEGNKLIAEFMGAKHIWKYHYSWQWLMPVVEKIEGLGFQIEIELFSCYVIKLINDIEKSFVIESHEDSKIKAVWKAVIYFIEWYNKEQSVKESDTSKAT